MPRQPRFNLAAVPQHIIQRGNNRQATFFDDADRQYYLDLLAAAAKAHACDIHAYVLMPNHIHLLATPGATDGVSRLMQAVSGRYTQHVNAVHGRSGTLWGGRYKSCLVESERYLLVCHRYIESNPVRAGMVARAADYPWSSFRHNGLGEASAFITQHPLYQALGAAPDERREAYRDLFRGRMAELMLGRIRGALNQERGLAGERFAAEIEARLSRPVGPARRGRPKRPPRDLSVQTPGNQERIKGV